MAHESSVGDVTGSYVFYSLRARCMPLQQCHVPGTVVKGAVQLTIANWRDEEILHE